MPSNVKRYSKSGGNALRAIPSTPQLTQAETPPAACWKLQFRLSQRNIGFSTVLTSLTSELWEEIRGSEISTPFRTRQHFNGRRRDPTFCGRRRPSRRTHLLPLMLKPGLVLAERTFAGGFSGPTRDTRYLRSFDANSNYTAASSLTRTLKTIFLRLCRLYFLQNFNQCHRRRNY